MELKEKTPFDDLPRVTEGQKKLLGWGLFALGIAAMAAGRPVVGGLLAVKGQSLALQKLNYDDPPRP